MPRKTKEAKELEKEENTSKKAVKSTSPKKTATKKSTTQKSTTGKEAKTTKKASTSSKETKTAKRATKKSATGKETKTAKSSTAKKAKTTTKKSTVSKGSTKKNIKRKTTSKKKIEIVEYYDLPYRYNQTVVKVLAQTPTNLFIYWDISDTDRKNFKKQYGEHFFEQTRPILLVHNTTLHYSFEVEINDFANSWYLSIPDSKCNYQIELGRRPLSQTESFHTDYIYVATSNPMEAPNDRILLDEPPKTISFRNVKTGKISTRTISSLSFIQTKEKIENLYRFYQAIYQQENIEEFYDVKNPSSGRFSSKFR